MPTVDYDTPNTHIITGGTRLVASQPPEWDSMGFGGTNLIGHPATGDVFDNWCMQVRLHQPVALAGEPIVRMYITDASIHLWTFTGFPNMNLTGELVVELLMDPNPLPFRNTDGAIAAGEFDPRTYPQPHQRRVIHRRTITSDEWPIVTNTAWTLILDADAIALINSIITDPRWPATASTRTLVFFFYFDNGGNPDLVGGGPGGLTSWLAGAGLRPFFRATCRYINRPWQTGDTLLTRPNAPPVNITTANYDNGSVAMLDEDSGPEQGMQFRHDGVSRIDRCPRCGNRDLRAKWVRDDWNRNMLVCQQCWDPKDPLEDPRQLRPEREPIGED